VALRFVSPALRRIVFPILSKSGLLRYMAGDGPAVVTYHGVFPRGYVIRNQALDGNLVHADSLRRQLGLLKRGYNIIAPEDFLRWSEGGDVLPARSVLLTCDDALRNTLTEMVPILREFDASCLFFATGASYNTTPSMLWYE
jgi:peptidoglycan/xylan/chitin deacetylase (PgdA/CDA1 family)